MDPTTGRGQRRRRLAAGAAATVLGMTAGVAPAVAAPDRVEETVTDLFAIWASERYDRAVFVNTTRDEACSPEIAQFEQDLYDWFAGGQVGDPPEFPGLEASEPVTFTQQRVATDNVKAGFEQAVPVELWTFETGKTWGNLFSPCLDTDGFDDATGQPLEEAGALVASGTGTWVGYDNDRFGTGPRSNVWGSRLMADLSGPNGEWKLSAHESNHSIDGEYKAGGIWFLLSPR
jgi:hypothetical protein